MTVPVLLYIEFSTISPIIAHCLQKVTKYPKSSHHQSNVLVDKCVPKTLVQPWLY